MGKNRTKVLVIGLLLIVGLALITCSGNSKSKNVPTPTAQVLVTPIATNTLEPTDSPPPTPSPYPTATPDGWELTITPTQIVWGDLPDVLLQIIIDPEAVDGVRVRSGPGYDCPTNDPNCNWTGSMFPSEPPDPDMFPLLQVDTSEDIAWCEYVSNFSLGANWSACEYLEPATKQECDIAEDLDLAEHLSPC